MPAPIGIPYAATSNSDHTLGGPPVNHLTKGEIALIVILAFTLVLLIFLIFYCRLLASRRETDEQNQGKYGSVVNNAFTKVSTKAVDNQNDGRKSQIGTSVEQDGIGLWPLQPAHLTGPQSANDQQQAAPKKKPLWDYIHWKDPHNTPIPRVVARGEPKNADYMAPNPYGIADKR